MIIVYEPTWTGTTHAPGNSATIQVLARAYPEQHVRVLADPAHLVELQADPALTGLANISFAPTSLSPLFPGRPQIVSARRFWREFRVLRRAQRAAPRGENVLLFLISTTATSLFAASLLVRLGRGRTGAMIGWHGNLNDGLGWRPRNPLARAMDFRAGLLARHPAQFRHLVLEHGIKDALAVLLPTAAERTDVLPLPINVAEVPAEAAQTLGTPIHIGLVGQATAAKGIDFFLDAAGAAKALYGDNVEFTLVGRAMPGRDLSAFSVLAHPVETEHLSRAAFTARLAKLHYVFLPLDAAYYGLSASGALIDAITWLKPVIANRVPIVDGMFRQYGDIGHVAESREAMAGLLEQIVGAPDPVRYEAQVAALRAARATRMPAALAATFQAIMRNKMPGLLPDTSLH